jgi:hypothetical protein
VKGAVRELAWEALVVAQPKGRQPEAEHKPDKAPGGGSSGRPPSSLSAHFRRNTPETVVLNHPHRPDAALSDCWSTGWCLARSLTTPRSGFRDTENCRAKGVEPRARRARRLGRVPEERRAETEVLQGITRVRRVEASINGQANQRKEGTWLPKVDSNSSRAPSERRHANSTGRQFDGANSTISANSTSICGTELRSNAPARWPPAAASIWSTLATTSPP